MKKTLISLAVLAVATSAFAHDAAVSGVGSNAVTSKSSAIVSALNGGSASAQSFNQGYARTELAVHGDVSSTNKYTGTSFIIPITGSNVGTKAGDVSVTGKTDTLNMSYAVSNVSGIATANANAVGTAVGHVEGAGAFKTVAGGPKGDVSGYANSQTNTDANAAAHQPTSGPGVSTSSYLVNVGTSSAFDTRATADRTITDVYSNFKKVASTDVKNAVTIANVSSTSMLGFANAPAIANVNGTGGAYNTGNASALANASVSANISAIDLDAAP